MPHPAVGLIDWRLLFPLSSGVRVGVTDCKKLPLPARCSIPWTSSSPLATTFTPQASRESLSRHA